VGVPAAPAADAGPAPDIVLEDVGHRYPSGVLALDGIDLTVRGGEAVAIVGANGGGKSTLLRHLDGLLRPTAGRVSIGGRDARDLSVAKLAATVALAFQDPDAQIFARRVADEVAFGPRQLGRDRATVAQAVQAALQAVGLEGEADAHPGDLGESGRKLLTIASVLAMACPVLVLDEPTAGLDDAGGAMLARIVEQHRSQGGTVIAVSHDEAFVRTTFRRVVRLESGHIAADGAPREVLALT
jgi:energy-coupling factor transport system ATP-binding protein